MLQYPAYLSPDIRGGRHDSPRAPQKAAQVLLWSMQGASAMAVLAAQHRQDMAVSELHQQPATKCLLPPGSKSPVLVSCGCGTQYHKRGG